LVYVGGGAAVVLGVVIGFCVFLFTVVVGLPFPPLPPKPPLPTVGSRLSGWVDAVAFISELSQSCKEPRNTNNKEENGRTAGMRRDLYLRILFVLGVKFPYSTSPSKPKIATSQSLYKVLRLPQEADSLWDREWTRFGPLGGVLKRPSRGV
jgi:hypothetical protein